MYTQMWGHKHTSQGYWEAMKELMKAREKSSFLLPLQGSPKTLRPEVCRSQISSLFWARDAVSGRFSRAFGLFVPTITIIPPLPHPYLTPLGGRGGCVVKPDALMCPASFPGSFLSLLFVGAFFMHKICRRIENFLFQLTGGLGLFLKNTTSTQLTYRFVSVYINMRSSGFFQPSISKLRNFKIYDYF